MSKIANAMNWMIGIAADDSHGYDQVHRWGEFGDYDCSSFIITALENAGIPAKSSGATYTGNMYSVLTRIGFKDISSSVNKNNANGMLPGDILLNDAHHVAMYIGDRKEVEASINERGKSKGGQPGDQTGYEILVRRYRNYPWNHILRYMEEPPKPETIRIKQPVLAPACYFDRSKANGVKLTVKVSDFLWLRSSASTSTSKNCIVQMPPDAKLLWYGYFNKVGITRWPLVVYTDENGTQIKGYCSSQYLV